MKLVRFGDRRTGLVVDLEAGPHIIDVVASVGALLPHDPISNGVLNGILREGGDLKGAPTFVGSRSRATCDTVGIACCRSRRRFLEESMAMLVMLLRFPPGLEKLDTRCMVTGS